MTPLDRDRHSFNDLTETEKAYIEKIVYEVVPKVLMVHIETCPYGKRINNWVAMSIGMAVVLALLGIKTFPDLWTYFKGH